MLTQTMPSAKVYSKRNSTNKVYFLLTTVKRIQHDMSIFSFSRAVMGVLLRMLSLLPSIIFSDLGLEGLHTGSSQEQDTRMGATAA